MLKFDKHAFIKAGVTLFGISLFVVLIINLSQPVSLVAQVYNNQSGVETTTITKTCESVPNIPNNTLCQLSNNIQNGQSGNQQNVGTQQCSNGGTPLNGICPASVIPINNSTVISTPPSTPVIPSEDISMLSELVFYDSLGNQVLKLSNSVPLQLQSFISPHNQNYDISKGKILFDMIIHAKPNELIVGNGTLWVSLNNKTLHTSGIMWGVNGMTDSNGDIIVNLQIPTGIVKQYVFDVGMYYQSINLPSNILNFTTSNIKIQSDNKMSYSSGGMKTLYALQLDYDPNMIISKVNGSPVRTYPSDDSFTLIAQFSTSSTTTTHCVYRTGQCGSQSNTVYTAPQNIGYGEVFLEGSQNGYEQSVGKTSFVGNYVGYNCGVSSFAGSVTSNSCSTSGGVTSSYVQNIPRDTDVRFHVYGGVTEFNKIIHTDKLQHSYKYVCTPSGCNFS